MSNAVPDSYAAWRHCIEIDCAQPLTAPFIAQRLASLRDAGEHHTQQFLRRWGQPHHRQVIDWFERALLEVRPTS
ncbi:MULTISPECIES: hypothetical protein [Xanthomonas]|uniref:Uncharacterized protein n=1 Tax=Xanthomonas cucurbitae TaxID=56453 RepID=A0A2S7DK52_9XANT|nr:hypothetical protein [Xanthomonas cucurbitae]PPU74202.1 hypothetical protein XcuCFBP2542_15910 [Xanthomonas cucurbitae]WDM66083.1 hypothetical protein K6981_10850 [Xanthomonas cucurbitae]WDM69962.1 hypothetical protein K6978_10825 [Xanthomonas cucurbitae]WDM73821.1 hypothetical protein K6982_10040 [Xanthomonas cucurbitae]WDM80980.1 hypothetical protein K6980_08405 [Xanthomonas cucurbitae]